MKKIFLKRIYHRDGWRIGIYFDYDEAVKELVKQIPGSAYSSTNRCFYVDDSAENLKLIFKNLRDKVEIDISALTGTVGSSVMPDDWLSTSGHYGVGPGIAESSNDALTDESTKENEGKEKNDYLPGGYTGGFHEDIHQRTRLTDNYRSSREFGAVEFRTGENRGTLIIKFMGRYDPEWISEIRSYGRCYYDKARKEWILGWSQMKCDSLADYFARRGIKVNVIKYRVNQELYDERRLTGDEVRSRSLGKKSLDALDTMAEYLDENRYSPRTRESYLAVLEFFFRYYDAKDPAEITEDEISRFIYDFIIKLGYSASYQNQVVSAIKTYYAISGRGRVNPGKLERPRRQRVLPKVLSKEEVGSILNSVRNIKHKLLLWMIYSCGLRRSEVTNIMLPDLDRDRSLIHIREGKGGVDRIVPVSGRVWDKVDEYLSSYNPRNYLFEGQTGGRYSAESVYQVFKGALKRAGIKKEVGVHSLRHSYATHLHENGVDIRYIQELLGHRSTRTTEIYTHVSRRNLAAVRSPIEDLDIK